MFFLNKKTATLFLVIVFFVIIDRFLKFLAVNFSGSPTRLAGDIFKFNFTENYNIAFSLPLGGAILNVAVTLIIFGLIFYFSYFLKQKKMEAAVFLFAIILGAASNLADRIQYGYVIDYFDLKYFTVFNLADALIVGGAAGLLWFLGGLDAGKKV